MSARRWVVLRQSWVMLNATPAAQAPLEETVQRVAQLLDAQDLAGAKAAVSDGLRTYPTSAALHNFAGVIDAQQGTFTSAESHFRTAIKLAPRSPGPYDNLGRLYQERSAVTRAHETRRSHLPNPSGSRPGKPGGAVSACVPAGPLRAVRRIARSGRWSAAGLRTRPQVLAVLAADFAGQNDPKTAATVAALESHAELTASTISLGSSSVRSIKDDTVPRRLLEALDRAVWRPGRAAGAGPSSRA